MPFKPFPKKGNKRGVGPSEEVTDEYLSLNKKKDSSKKKKPMFKKK